MSNIDKAFKELNKKKIPGTKVSRRTLPTFSKEQKEGIKAMHRQLKGLK